MVKGLFMFFVFVQISNAQNQQETEIKIFSQAMDAGDKIGEEWELKPANDCVPNIEVSPKEKNQRAFLARIPTGKQSLKLDELPKHSHVRVQFDLIIQGSWDGIHSKWGPDLWRFDIDDGSPLVYSSFCNYSASLQQSFPDFHGDKYKVNKYYTGSAELETLGYTWQGSQGPNAADSIYHFDFQVPHVSEQVSINFQSIFNDVGGPEASKDQWYGLDNVIVSVVNNPQRLPENEIKKNIDLLKSIDATKRYTARVNLVKSDVAFVKWLEQTRVGGESLDVDKWVTELSSPIHAERETATQKLLEHGLSHRVELKKLLSQTEDPEVRARLGHVFGEWGSGDQKEDYYNYEREVERLLKIINTPKAKKLLAEMAKTK